MAVVREVKEESGYDVIAQKLAAVYDQDQKRHGHPPMPFHIYTLIFLCELVGEVQKQASRPTQFRSCRGLHPATVSATGDE